MTLVKICGLNAPDAIAAATSADFAGFVFYPPSPRAVAPAQAAKLAGRLPRRVRRVALFVDPDDAALRATFIHLRPDIVQLHGKETPERVAAIKARTGKPVMKAFNVSAASDIERGIAAYMTVADRLMFDAAEGTLPGGNAEVFDWAFLSGRKVPLPWMLAGGLRPDNVAEAVRVTGAPIVDVSSGVESSRGVKSIELIRAFLDRVKAL